jgi:hypothetical protein
MVVSKENPFTASAMGVNDGSDCETLLLEAIASVAETTVEMIDVLEQLAM